MRTRAGGVPPSIEPRLLLDGIALGESPRWHDGRLWFSDWGAREVVAVTPDGEREVILEAPALPFCLDWLPDGRLLVVAGRDGLLLRRESGGELVTHADLTTLAVPPWNDIVVDARGNAYVGGTGFDFPGGAYAPGTVALVAPDGTVREVADDVAFPNGAAITPDGATLILAESYGNRLTAWDIAADGGLSGRGEIVIENRNGVVFGPNARVQAGSLVATALLTRRVTAAALELSGRAAMVGGPDQPAVQQSLFMPAEVIGGGTMEIQLNIIATMILGLPRR